MRIIYVVLFGWLLNVQAADLTVNVSNISVKQGIVRLALYNEAKDFPEGAGRVQGQEFNASKDKLSFVFKALAAGRYAIAVMQDSNSNGMLDRNFFGVPTEPYGFSQQKKGENSSLSFEQASFSLDSADKTIDIELVK